MNRDSLNRFVRSRLFAGIIAGFSIACIVLCIFEAGVAVGHHEGMSPSHWGENYARNFVDPSQGLGMLGLDDHQPNSDGAFGTIVSMSSSSITIESNQMPEQQIVLGSDTVIRYQHSNVTSDVLAIGSEVVVLGTPTSGGEIDAKLIRILSPVLGNGSSTPTTSSD